MRDAPRMPDFVHADLEPRTFDFLNEQGHVGFEDAAKARRDPAIVEPSILAIDALAHIYARLKGDPTVLPAARSNLLLTVHAHGDQVVEHDGPEHFTSFRALSLTLYPPDAQLGFDRDEHLRLCAEHATSSDRIDRALAAKGFGFGGVPRE